MPSEPARARKMSSASGRSKQDAMGSRTIQGHGDIFGGGPKSNQGFGGDFLFFWQGNNIWGLVLRTRYSYVCMLHFVWLITLMVSEASARLLATG